MRSLRFATKTVALFEHETCEFAEVFDVANENEIENRHVLKIKYCSQAVKL